MCDNFPESPPSTLGVICHYWKGAEATPPTRSQASSSGVCPKGTKPKNLTEPGPNSELSHPFPRDMDRPPGSRGQPPLSLAGIYGLRKSLFLLPVLFSPSIFFFPCPTFLLSFAANLRSSDAEGVRGPQQARQRRAQRSPPLCPFPSCHGIYEWGQGLSPGRVCCRGSLQRLKSNGPAGVSHLERLESRSLGCVGRTWGFPSAGVSLQLWPPWVY